jgi:cell division protein YceG involved in septum cleavage
MRKLKRQKIVPIALIALAVGSVVFLLPTSVAWSLHYGQEHSALSSLKEFPVTVDPARKVIVEDALVNAILESPHSPFQVAIENTGNALLSVFTWLGVTVADMSWYQSLAAADGTRLVTITSGMRKEQAANAFAKALRWDSAQKKAFMAAPATATLPLAEGSFSPGTYAVAPDTTPAEAQALVNERFSEEILSHYGTTTAAVVPLEQALTIASLIEREAGGANDMRAISGIIWNRIFVNMRLQIDATIQYAKANSPTAVSWWPKVVPADIFRTSVYNTYQHTGLPPTPIANPSVAAVLAALNPIKTSCMFYFHDNAGQFHCSDTYAAHVALLKQYFGRGK